MDGHLQQDDHADDPSSEAGRMHRPRLPPLAGRQAGLWDGRRTRNLRLIRTRGTSRQDLLSSGAATVHTNNLKSQQQVLRKIERRARTVAEKWKPSTR